MGGQRLGKSSDVVKEADGVTYYNRVMRESPGNVAALLYRGVAFRMKRDYANALKDFTEVIRLDPASASAYAERATTYDHLHQYDKAVADLNQAIRLAPTWLCSTTTAAAQRAGYGRMPRPRRISTKRFASTQKWLWPIPIEV